MNNNTTISPAEYFAQVKSRKQVMTEAGLTKLYENCLTLLDEYQRSGQIAAQKKLLFHIDNITREKKLLDVGIDTFVYKSDVDDFIHMVDNKVIKIVELENYQRRIPAEIIDRIEKCKGIFDKMYVVFTDYTRREERRVEAVKREKDPILFGTFQDAATHTIVFAASRKPWTIVVGNVSDTSWQKWKTATLCIWFSASRRTKEPPKKTCVWRWKRPRTHTRQPTSAGFTVRCSANGSRKICRMQLSTNGRSITIMFDELKWRYEILLDMYRGKEVTMKKELEEYKNAHPLLPVPADDPNVGKMIRAKNSAIRGQYTRRENKIRAMWDEFYTRLGNVVSTVYLLPKDVATLVVEKARSDDLDEYDEPGKINEFAEFANEIVNAIE